MLESKLSYRFVFKIVAFYVFINLFLASFCTTKIEYPQKGDYSFNLKAFFISNIILLLICVIILLIGLSEKRKIIIHENKIIVQTILSRKSVEFHLTEILGLNWGFTNTQIGGRGYAAQARSTTQNICIIFQDGSELPINNYEYQNYEELKDFFYTYCQENNLIKETTGQIRRKSRLKMR